MNQTARNKLWPLLVLTAALSAFSACSATGVAGMAVAAGRKFLMSTASQNYQADYTDNLAKLVDSMMEKFVPGVTPGIAPGDPAAPQPAVGEIPPTDPGAVPALPPEPVPLDPIAINVPIELEVAIVKEVVVEGQAYAIPVADGDTLHDGYGREGEGDNFKITFRANQSCYVYVVAVDATAWAQPVFPGMSSFSNPVQAGQTYEIPGGEQWFFLDNYRGVESFYFMASPGPRADIEGVLNDLAGLHRELDASEEVALIDKPADLTRGIGGQRKGQVVSLTAQDGSILEGVPSQSFLASMGGGDILITRWFRHR